MEKESRGGGGYERGEMERGVNVTGKIEGEGEKCQRGR